MKMKLSNEEMLVSSGNFVLIFTLGIFIFFHLPNIITRNNLCLFDMELRSRAAKCDLNFKVLIRDSPFHGLVHHENHRFH